MPKSLLTLDQATLSGFCNWKPGTQPVLSSLDLGFVSDNLGRFISVFEKNLRKNIEENQVDYICFESPILIRMGKKSTGLNVAMKLYNLVGTIEKVCSDLMIPCAEVQVGEWRKHFLGSGGYSTEQAKQHAVNKCRAAGFDPKCHDEAEAFGIMDYVATLKSLKKNWPEPGRLKFT